MPTVFSRWVIGLCDEVPVLNWLLHFLTILWHYSQSRTYQLRAALRFERSPVARVVRLHDGRRHGCLAGHELCRVLCEANITPSGAMLALYRKLSGIFEDMSCHSCMNYVPRFRKSSTILEGRFVVILPWVMMLSSERKRKRSYIRAFEPCPYSKHVGTRLRLYRSRCW